MVIDSKSEDGRIDHRLPSQRRKPKNREESGGHVGDGRGVWILERSKKRAQQLQGPART